MMDRIKERIAERREFRRARKGCKEFLEKQNTPEALAVLANEDAFNEFVDECIAEQASSTEGLFADIISKMIDSFLEDPEKWIAILIRIFGGL